jgi:hypothetical protein
MTNCYTAPLPMFSLGRIVMTESAAKTLSHNDIATALLRHAQGDWGDVSLQQKEPRNDVVFAAIRPRRSPRCGNFKPS